MSLECKCTHNIYDPKSVTGYATVPVVMTIGDTLIVCL